MSLLASYSLPSLPFNQAPFKKHSSLCCLTVPVAPNTYHFVQWSYLSSLFSFFFCSLKCFFFGFFPTLLSLICMLKFLFLIFYCYSITFVFLFSPSIIIVFCVLYLKNNGAKLWITYSKMRRRGRIHSC